jgi:integrase
MEEIVTKRADNEGSVFYSESRKRWRGYVTVAGGSRRYVSHTTKAGCAKELRALQSKVDAGLPTGDADRLSAFLAWWLKSLEAKSSSGSKSVNTVDNAAWAVDTWITPALGTKRLREITPEDVERLLAEMAAAGRGRRTVARVRSYLGQALAAAERRGKVDRNVARIAEMPATKAPSERRALTPDEAKTVLAVAEDCKREAPAAYRLRALFTVALMLGLRPGELTGLRWSDVDLEAGTLSVSGSLKSERGELRLGDAKTTRSWRTVALPRPVLEALKAHKRRQATERLAAGCAWRALDLVFASEVGTPIDPSNLRRMTTALCEAAGVDPVSPNELGRHSAASLLYDAGMSLDAIADLLGHASTRMLEAHYRHRVRASFSAHVAPMESLFGAT